MSVSREVWLNRRSADIVDAVSLTDITISYEDCKDRIYKQLTALYLRHSDSIAAMNTSELTDYNRNAITSYISDKKPFVVGYIHGGKAELNRLAADLIDDITNMGPITHALADPDILEIQINDYKTIFVEHRTQGSIHLRDIITGDYVKFNSPEEALNICNKLLRLSNVALSREGALQGGITQENYRVAGIHLSCAAPDKGAFKHSRKSPAAVIRKFNDTPYELADLIGFKSMSVEAARYLTRLPKAGMTIVVAGATGSGKTVLLQAIAAQRPSTMRTMAVEDQSELGLHKRNKDGIDMTNTIQIEARPDMADAAGSYPSFKNIIIQMLRMTPELFILGEIRTNEVINQAMIAANTGHTFQTTIHAGSVEATITRIANAVVSVVPGIPYDVILEEVCTNIPFIISQQKIGDNSRKLLEIAEICGITHKNGRVVPVINTIFKYIGDGNGIDQNGKLHGMHYQVGRISDRMNEKLALKALTREDLDILRSGPAEGEEPIPGTYDADAFREEMRKGETNSVALA